MPKALARIGLSFACVAIASSAWAVDLRKGLILNFTFDAATGDAVKDLSDGGHDGQLLEGAKIATDVKKNGNGAIRIAAGQQAMEVKTFAALET